MKIDQLLAFLTAKVVFLIPVYINFDSLISVYIFIILYEVVLLYKFELLEHCTQWVGHKSEVFVPAGNHYKVLYDTENRK